MRQVQTYAMGGDPISKSTENTNGNNFISRMASKARALREKVTNFLAPREIEEFAMATA